MDELRMPCDGLCAAFNLNFIDKDILEYYFEPNKQELLQLVNEGVIDSAFIFWGGGFWAVGLPIRAKHRDFTFTPLRQTIVLLMALINDETF